MIQRQYRNRICGINKKVNLLAVALFLILGVTIGGTAAFLYTNTNKVENVFKESKVTTEVKETMDNGVKTDVYIKNTGDTDAWIRAAVVVTWQDENGNVYGQAPDEGTNYTVWALGTDWVKGSDGFYYYTKPVAAGGITGTALIDSISPIGDMPADGYYLTVEIIGSGIQSKPAEAFESAWLNNGLKVDDSNADPMQWKLIHVN